ncbi:hypothetical protein FMUND_14059 [Fusarium mundagurra]|uniref:Uncharacterized protein n=1 Tax=Fusarium mundagurra TaxID=1567541 RepID=A0A8H5XXH3_9HYPO|nr:hypothetical protein FMUND_14059 [Fusarium mundagurra]
MVMPFNLFKGALPPTGGCHSFRKATFPPPSFIKPDQTNPPEPRTEVLAITKSGQRGLPPPPLPRASASLRRKPDIRPRDPMAEMLQDIDNLLAHYEQQNRNSCTTFLLRRVPGEGLWLNYKRNAETITLTHNFDSVYVFTLGLMQQSLGKRNIRPTLLAESHSHHELAHDWISGSDSSRNIGMADVPNPIEPPRHVSPQHGPPCGRGRDFAVHVLTSSG